MLADLIKEKPEAKVIKGVNFLWKKVSGGNVFSNEDWEQIPYLDKKKIFNAFTDKI